MITVILLSILILAFLNSVEIISKIIVATTTAIMTILILAALSGAALIAVAHQLQLLE